MTIAKELRDLGGKGHISHPSSECTWGRCISSIPHIPLLDSFLSFLHRTRLSSLTPCLISFPKLKKKVLAFSKPSEDPPLPSDPAAPMTLNKSHLRPFNTVNQSSSKKLESSESSLNLINWLVSRNVVSLECEFQNQSPLSHL